MKPSMNMLIPCKMLFRGLHSYQVIGSNVTITINAKCNGQGKIISKSKVLYISPLLALQEQHRVASTFLSPYVLSNTLSSSEGNVVSTLCIL